MNDESLSALLDGECSPSELDAVLRQLDHDPAQRARFGRMAAARDALHGHPIAAVPADFADRVMRALDRDPVGPTPAPAAAARAPRPVWKPVVAVALAASVAAIAVLALRPDTAPAPVAAPVAAAPVPAAVATPVAFNPDAAAPASLDEAQARQLRNYLMTYSQARAQQGVAGGTLGYARFATQTDAQDAPR